MKMQPSREKARAVMECVNAENVSNTEMNLKQKRICT